MADGGAFHGTSRKTFTYKNGNKLRTVCYSGDNFDIPGYRIEHVYNKEGKEIRNYVYKDPNTNKADTVYVYYEYYWEYEKKFGHERITISYAEWENNTDAIINKINLGSRVIEDAFLNSIP